MMQSVWYGRFVAKLAEKHDEVTAHLVGGGAASHEAYRQLVGYLNGIKDALQIAAEVDRQILGVSDVPGNSPQDD
jgi:hypothetical protein